MRRNLEVAGIALGATGLALVVGIGLHAALDADGKSHTRALGRANPTVTSASSSPQVPWPAEALAGHQPGRAPNEQCSEQRNPSGTVEVGESWPRDLRTLVARSNIIVVVEALEQRSWWHEPSAGENSFRGVMPYTATNYRVQRVVRGTLPAAIQLAQQGASDRADMPCAGWAWTWSNNPLPKVGHRYVLFLKDDRGEVSSSFGALSHFEIVSDVVFSTLDLDPEADVSFRMGPTPLEQFIQRIGD